MSLDDCIQSALEKNLDMRIARYNPPMSLMDLQTAYAGYNPNFTVAGQHSFSMSGGGFNSQLGILDRGHNLRRKHLQQQFGRINAVGVEL